MAVISLNMSLAILFLTSIFSESLAQPSCAPTIVNLQPCIPFMQTNSTSNPNQQCCTQLSSMVQTQVSCLCTFLNAAPPLPFNINRTQAITLPGSCKIQAPPLSQCNAAQSGPSIPAIGSPQTAPAPSASVTPSATISPTATPSAPAGGSSPATTTTPSSNGGSKTVPSKGQPSSSSSSPSRTSAAMFGFSSSLVFLASALI